MNLLELKNKEIHLVHARPKHRQLLQVSCLFKVVKTENFTSLPVWIFRVVSLKFLPEAISNLFYIIQVGRVIGVLSDL